MARASMPARDRAHRRWKRPTRGFSFLCEAGFSAGDAVNALMTISYLAVGAVLEQAGDSDAGERGGAVEQAPALAAVAGRNNAFDEAHPGAQRSSRDSR